MDSEWIIGALAFFTIGGILGLAIFHFGVHLKDPANRAAAKSVVNDQESAATGVSTESVDNRSLRQRLDDAPRLNQRLSNRPTGSLSIGAFFDTKWSVLRSTLKG